MAAIAHAHCFPGVPLRTSRLLATLAVPVRLAGLLGGCSFEIGGADAVSKTELEKQVAGLYTADNPDDEITATCEGELAAEVDATTDCEVLVGEETANVHVTVSKVDGSDVEFELAPYVPAERVAETIKANLASQNYQVETVECEDELAGELEATTTCQALPADGDGTIQVTVTQVDGLLVNFNYEVVA